MRGNSTPEASEMVLLNTDRSVLQDWLIGVPKNIKMSLPVPPSWNSVCRNKSNPDESFSKSRVFVFLYHEQSQRKTDFHKNTLAQPCILACDWLLIKCCLRAHGTWITFEPYTHTNTHTSSQRLFNKASPPWRPACLVFYIIIINIIHNLVSICYSCECVCVCVSPRVCFCFPAAASTYGHACVYLWAGTWLCSVTT